MDHTITAAITVYGKVQGVGFRPLVCRLAASNHITGFVKNAGAHVEIVAAGSRKDIDGFCSDLRSAEPPVRVDELLCSDVPPERFPSFISAESSETEEVKRVSADMGICPHCLREVKEKGNRRQGYSYISCAQCGPRYTIIRRLPYDRSNTTMDAFALCGECAAEYTDMQDRRGHGETISCFHCGPQLTCFLKDSNAEGTRFSPEQEENSAKLEEENGSFESVADRNAFLLSGNGKSKTAARIPDHKIIRTACDLLEQNRIIMAKAVGGFNLLCRADDLETVTRLRDLKKRMSKPFAVMVSGVSAAEKFCFVSDEEKRLLESEARPIVLLQKKHHGIPLASDGEADVPGFTPQGRKRAASAADKDTEASEAGDLNTLLPAEGRRPFLAENVTDVSGQAGVFLPPMGFYACLAVPFPVIVTSCNYTGEPILYGDEEAFRFFEAHDAIAALFTYGREILRPADDAVVRAVKEGTGPVEPDSVKPGRTKTEEAPDKAELLRQPQGVQILRRTKGYMPEAAVTGSLPGRVLAVGAQMEPGFCLTADGCFFPAEIPGDITLEKTENFFAASAADWMQLLNIRPEAVVADLHPAYATTRWGRQFAQQNGLPFYQVQHHHAHALAVMAENRLSGPVLAACFDGTGYGTDGTVWGGEFLLCEGAGFTRVGHVKTVSMLGGDISMQQAWKTALCHLVAAGIEREDFRLPVVKAALRQKINCIETSSMGRLFDAAASLLGLADFNSHQGRCAMALEAAARNAVVKKIQPLPLSFAREETVDENTGKTVFVYDPAPLWRTIARGSSRKAGEEHFVSAAALGFHNAVTAMVTDMAAQSGIAQVALCGGCFANRILLESSVEELRRRGLRVYYNKEVSPGDGGISVGQAYYGLLQGKR